MKRTVFIALAFFTLQTAISGPKKGTGMFSNITVSEKIKMVQESPKDLILIHEALSKSVHIIADEQYVYLEYKGEIMGQFLKKFAYTIVPKEDKIDIIVKKRNGKFVSKYFIIESGEEVRIAEAVH